MNVSELLQGNYSYLIHFPPHFLALLLLRKKNGMRYGYKIT